MTSIKPEDIDEYIPPKTDDPYGLKYLAAHPSPSEVRARAEELRAKLGLKKGGGGQQQVFAGHGKYGTAFDLAVARAEAAKQRKAGTTSTVTIEPLTISPTMTVNSAVDADLRKAAGIPPEPSPYKASFRAKAIVQRDLSAGLLERARSNPELAAALKAESEQFAFDRGGMFVAEAGRILHVEPVEATRLRDDAEAGGLELGARVVAQRHLDNWAATSSDSHPYALATQKIAADRFGLDSSWVDERAKHLDDNLGKLIALTGEDDYDTNIAKGPKRTVIESILDLQYANTQATLKRAGITELPLARGVEEQFHGNGSTTSYQLSPMSSWTSDSSVANDFARGGTVLLANVPASRIISTFATGAGCLPESEYIVLGSPRPDTIRAEPPGDSDGW